MLLSGRNLVLADRLVLVHALHVLRDDVVFAEHRLLVWMGCALLTAERASFTAETVVLLPALRVVLLDVAVEGVLMRGQPHHVVGLGLGASAHLSQRILVEALLGLVDHALVVTAYHHFLFAYFGLLPAEVVLHALGHVVDENGVGLLQRALLLWTFTRQIVRKRGGCVLFATQTTHRVVFSVESASDA